MPKATEDTKRREPTSINVDPELWRDAKIAAIKRGITVTELFENALGKEIGYSQKKIGERSKIKVVKYERR